MYVWAPDFDSELPIPISAHFSFIMDASAVANAETGVLLLLLQTIIAELLRRSGHPNDSSATVSGVQSPGTPPLIGCDVQCEVAGCTRTCYNPGSNHTRHTCYFHRNGSLG